MAISKSAVTVLASASCAAGTTKASPGQTSSAIDCRNYYGGELGWKVTNGASAPGVACTILFQVSHDGSNWYDYHMAGGDVVNSSINSGAVELERWIMYVRFIAYGNTTNAVTVESYLQATTAL